MLESVLMFGEMAYCLAGRPRLVVKTFAFGVVMLAVQAYIFFRPPPASGPSVATTALGAYANFALVIWWLQDRREA